MTYEEFLEFVPSKCMYETIYDDSEGRTILVISMLDAYGMVNKAALAQEQEPWCMKTYGCKTKCEDCPVEVAEQEQLKACVYCGQLVSKERT